MSPTAHGLLTVTLPWCGCASAEVSCTLATSRRASAEVARERFAARRRTADTMTLSASTPRCQQGTKHGTRVLEAPKTQAPTRRAYTRVDARPFDDTLTVALSCEEYEREPITPRLRASCRLPLEQRRPDAAGVDYLSPAVAAAQKTPVIISLPPLWSCARRLQEAATWTPRAAQRRGSKVEPSEVRPQFRRLLLYRRCASAVLEADSQKAASNHDHIHCRICARHDYEG